ncbi:hypothetical protein ACN38_g8328 [Penicillium nordicum]|uniref:Uncharacterized protein n=1 Tax=Penicillium nordicum TaxID=229535 RepID=A0A0M8P3V7_9EURO|nr:hypothetical protein ACN38_g8328 [Penicillium nordicum]
MQFRANDLYIYVVCYVQHSYTYLISSAGWGFPILAAAAFIGDALKTMAKEISKWRTLGKCNNRILHTFPAGHVGTQWTHNDLLEKGANK